MEESNDQETNELFLNESGDETDRPNQSTQIIIDESFGTELQNTNTNPTPNPNNNLFLNTNPSDSEHTDSTYKRAFYTLFELTDEDLNKIEDHIKQKIIQNGENFLQKHDALQSSYEKFKIEYEQRFIELESEFTECQTKLSIESKNSHLYQIKANENEERLSTLIKQNKILENEKETSISNQQRLSTINQNLEAEKRDLLNLLDKRVKENDRLNEEWKSINTKLTETESKICEYTAQLEEMKNKESTIIFREKQFQSDKERLLNEIEWLNKQLKDKSMQILETKGNLNQKIYDLESKIEDFTAESRKNKNLIEALQTANQNMEQQIEELSNKLKDAREREVQTRIDFSEETQSREKLIELYKEENSSCKSKLEEAGTIINELNQMIVEAKEEYSNLADEKSLNETTFDAKLKEKDEMIAKLEQELKNANELLSIAKRKGATVLSESDIEQLSPAAAVASRLLKSGMTLTQIYSEYVNLSENLQNEKRENERLKSYIGEVINEIEEKAPILKRQRQEYEEAIKTINNLTTQLENAMMDYEVLKSKSEDSIKKYNLVSSENARLKQDVNDMSRQVTVLLYEVEQLRSKLVTNQGNRTFKTDADNQADSTLANLFANNDSNDSYEVSSSSEAMTKNSFMFRNIEEMQKHNQKLMRLVHEISDKKQTEEKAELELRTKEFNEKLNLALRELDEFKTQREKQEQVLEEIRKQRDTYKQLLNQQQQQQHQQSKMQTSFYTSTPGGDQRIKPSITSTTPGQFSDMLIDQQNLDQGHYQNSELKKKLDETNTALEKLQKQFEKYQQKMISTNTSLNEEIDKYRSNNSDLSLKLALSESKLESALEKCKTLNTGAEKCRKELDTYKERGSKLNEVIIKHEQSINLTTMELNRTKERVSELETRLHSSTVERDMFKSNYERLSKEHELLIKENNSRTTILANLEMIRNSCDRNERETKLIYTQKIEQLERDNIIQRKQLEQDKDQHNVIVKSWQSQYDQLVQQRERENSESEKLRQEFVETKSQFDELKQRYNDIEAKLHSNEMLVQMTRNTKSSSAISRLTHLEEENKDLQMKLSLAEKEIVSLKIQLEDSKAHAKQYKNISDTIEKTMKEESEAHEKTKQILENRIEDLTERLNVLQAKYDDITESKNLLVETFGKDKESLELRISSLENDKKDLKSELELRQKQFENMEKILDERTRNRDDYVAKLTVLEEQIKNQTEKLSKTEEDLSNKSQELNELKNLFESIQDELEKEKKSKAEQVSSYDSSENVFRQEISKLKQENQDLLEQNNKLQQEFSKVGQDFVILQKQQDFGNTSMSITDEQSASNLLEINRFLRTQKEQLEEKYDNIKLTHDITQQKLKTVENELEFYRKQSQLHENEITQLKQSESSVTSSTGTDSLKLIIDTNKRLKEELDSMNAENNRLGDEIRKLDDEMSNLKANLNASELKNESLVAETSCMRNEVKKWKERADALLRNSDMSQEWIRMQAESQEAQEQNLVLTEMINDLRNTSADSNLKIEQLNRDLEAVKAQSTAEKQKLQQDLDNLRADKTKREEMFKTLVSELKEVVTTVQKEFQLKDIDWVGMKGPMADRLKNIKEEVSALRKAIIEKIRKDKDELKAKNKAIEDAQTELQPMSKKLEECENRLKEKDIKIGQLTNFMQSSRTRSQAYQKTIDDLQKEASELRSTIAHQQQQHQPQETVEQPNKQELDQLKSRFLQSQLDNERLKKELASTNTALVEANTKMSSSSSSTVISCSSSQVTSPASSQITSSQTSEPSTSTSTSQNMQQSQAPPTAYIAPSRITKVPPSQQQQQQQAQQQMSSSNPALRRTAAVHPTPHISQSTSEGTQWIPSQQVEQTISDDNREQQEQIIQITHEVTPSTSSGTSSSFMAKRTREDDHSEDASGASQTVTNKKQRSSNQDQFSNEIINLTNQADQQQQQVAAIEPFSDSNVASIQESDQNDYIVIHDEIQSSDGQDLNEENQNEEIVLDDDTNGASQESSYEDVIITRTAQRLTNENANSNSSNNYQQLDEANSNNNNNNNNDSEPIVEDANDNQRQTEDLEEETIDDNTNEIEEVIEQDDENNLDRSGDLHLESHGDEAENMDRNTAGGIIEDTNSQNDERKTEHQDVESQEANQAVEVILQDQNQNNQQSEGSQLSQEEKTQQEQQQQLKATSTEQSNQPSRTQAITTTTITSTFSTQSQSRPSFGSASGPPQIEKPKPIVWDGPSTSTQSTVITNTSLFQQQQQTLSNQSSASSLRIRRTPVSQSTAVFQQQAPQQASVANPNQSVNYFQQDVQLSGQQQQQQQQPQQGFGFQANQFRLQNSRFQLQNSTGSAGLTGTTSSQIGSSNEILFANQSVQQGQQMMQGQTRLTPGPVRGPRAQLIPQLAQQQQIQQQQVPGRIIPTLNARGGGNQAGGSTQAGRGGAARGGNAAGRGGRIF